MFFRRLPYHIAQAILVLTLVFTVSLIGYSVARLRPASAPPVVSQANIEPANQITVTSLADASGYCPGAACTLRGAIATATLRGIAATIKFGVSGTILVTSPLMLDNPAANAITIDGTGKSIVIDGGKAVSIFTVAQGSAATLNALTIQNADNPKEIGGAIINNGKLVISNSTLNGNAADANGGAAAFNGQFGQLVIRNSTISNNVSRWDGGAIFNVGSLTISNSTFSNNKSIMGVAGAIMNGGGSTLTISNSTLSGNSAKYNGGALFNAYGTVNILSTIIAGNSSPDQNVDFYGSFNSLGHNLIGNRTGLIASVQTAVGDRFGTALAPINPNLAALALNGGATQTMALLPGSVAIGAGDCAGSAAIVPAAVPVSTDQRGTTRATSCDIGAFSVAIGTTVNPPILLQKTPIVAQPPIDGSTGGGNVIGD